MKVLYREKKITWTSRAVNCNTYLNMEMRSTLSDSNKHVTISSFTKYNRTISNNVLYKDLTTNTHSLDY